MSTDVAITIPTFTVAAETGFTVTRLREFVTSSLSDAALQTYLDAAMDAIDDALGPVVCHERLSATHGDMLALGREAESITSVVEGWNALALATDDYELSDSGTILYRLHTGTNPAYHWHGRVHVTYVRDDSTAERIRVAVALVYLDLHNRPGLSSEQIGTWTETYAQGKPYAEARAELLASLGSGGPGIA
jgi:hypothetical protein